MYAIYTQPRPGRPRLALLTAAGVLLLTVLMALGIIHLKRTGQTVPLGEPQFFPAGQLKCRLPAGWKTETPQQQGVIAQTVEPEGKRRVIIFRGLPRRAGVPSDTAALAVAQLLNTSQPMAHGLMKVAVADAARIGPLPAWDIVVLHDRSPRGMARAALAPDGSVFGVLLLSPQAALGGTRVLDEISAGMEFTEIATAESKAAMDAAGIQFSAPAGTTFFRETTPRVGRVRMLGGEGDATWYLDAYRVPIIGARTPADLVTDLALNTLERPDLPREMEKNKLSEREYVEYAISLDEERPPSLLFACAQTAPDTALILIGRFESGASDTLRKTCQAIAREAKVTPYSQAVDVAAGQAKARQLLKSIATDGLRKSWNPLQLAGLQYLWQSPGYTWGHEAERYRSNQEDDGLWWEVRSHTKIEFGGVKVRELIERWLVKDDAGGHQCNSQVTGRLGDIGYMESRRPGSTEVRRELNASGSIRKLTTPVDDTYACEPVLFEAAARLATAGEASPAVFSATENFPQGAVHWIMLPAGELPVPGRKDLTAPAVLLLRDYDPDPVLLYFRKGQLLATSHDGTTWQALAGEDEPGE